MVRIVFVAVLAVLFLAVTDAFLPSAQRLSVVRNESNVQMKGYVPDGLSAEQYAKIKKEEAEKLKNLGKVGPNRFKSRSFADWHAAGGKHLFPVDPRKVKSGEIAIEDVPYMQRKGAWDNSDLKGNKNVRDKSKLNVQKTKSEVEYEKGGFRKEQSVSIFGGRNMPWTQKYEAMDVDLAIKGKGPKVRSKLDGGVSKEELDKMREELKKKPTVSRRRSPLDNLFGKKK
mmetsp:Transcript_11890/g.19109  ORF Transcript_11890/g.19109 Transcript_11890/m.19109 type:complete len:228 (-) Transcript_11890:505-1188(-)